MTKEFTKDAREYLETVFVKDEYNKTGIPQLRTIPIEQSIDYEHAISSYDEFRSVIDNIGEPIVNYIVSFTYRFDELVIYEVQKYYV